MKKIFLSLALLVGSVMASNAACYFYCYNGRGYIVTTNGNTVTSATPAGGCAGSMWGYQVACVVMPTLYDDNASTNIRNNFDPGAVTTVIPDGLQQAFDQDLQTGPLPKVFLNPEIITDQQAQWINSH